MATLIASSKNYTGENILVYDPMAGIDQAINKLMDVVFHKSQTEPASQRLEIKNGRYMYTPSNEYTNKKSQFIRAKFHK